MEPIDIETWIEKSDTSVIEEFRRAVHVVLVAISRKPFLQSHMIIKGGILLAVKFRSTRHTKDIDFSSSEKLGDIDKVKILEELKDGLIAAEDILPYGLVCKIQSHEVRPSRSDASFPTLKITIGYAYKGTPKHRRLLNYNCPDVLRIDFSFNEYNYEIDDLEIPEVGTIRAYSLVDLVSEKYRAILQQEVRDRFRRQDAYDIYWILENGYLEEEDQKSEILISLKIKAESRGLSVGRFSLRQEEIIRRSKIDYDTLAQEIQGKLPPFEEVYGNVKKYYESLPWDS